MCIRDSNNIDSVLAEPQAVHRGLPASIPDDLNGSIPTVASPLRLSQTPVRADLPPPRLGAHSREVLAEILGLDGAELDRLAETGVIASV